MICDKVGMVISQSDIVSLLNRVLKMGDGSFNEKLLFEIVFPDLPIVPFGGMSYLIVFENDQQMVDFKLSFFE